MADTLFTIGRTGNLRARTVSYDGGRLSLTGYVLPSSDAANGVLAARQQLRGLVDNPDTDIFPVTCSTNSTIDGYYRVASVSVDDVGVFNATKARFSIALDRVDPDATGVLIEGAGTVFTRTNSHAIIGADVGAASGPSGQWSVPAAATQVIPPNRWGKAAAPITRASATGSMFTTSILTASTIAVGQHLLPVANHYDGAATIERLYGSSNYQAVEGRQASLSASNWRLSNGLIRIQASATANRLFDIYSYNGSAWSTSAITINLYGENQAAAGATKISATNAKVEAVSVLRNTVEVCTLRLAVRFTSVSAGGSVGQAATNQYTYSTILVDISLRRGDHIAAVNVLTSPARYIKLLDNAAPASTGLTGGMRTTSNIANGNNDRLVVASPATVTHDSTSGILIDGTSRAGSVRSGLFGVGLEIGGSGASGLNAAQELIYQFLIPVSETQRVVLR